MNNVEERLELKRKSNMLAKQPFVQLYEENRSYSNKLKRQRIDKLGTSITQFNNANRKIRNKLPRGKAWDRIYKLVVRPYYKALFEETRCKIRDNGHFGAHNKNIYDQLIYKPFPDLDNVNMLE